MLFILYFFCLVSFNTASAYQQDFRPNIVTRTLTWLWYNLGMISQKELDTYTSNLERSLTTSLEALKKEQLDLKDGYIRCQENIKNHTEQEIKEFEIKLSINRNAINKLDEGLAAIEAAKKDDNQELENAFLRIAAINDKLAPLQRITQGQENNIKFFQDFDRQLHLIKKRVETAEKNITSADKCMDDTNKIVEGLKKEIEEEKEEKDKIIKEFRTIVDQTIAMKKENESLKRSVLS